MGRHAWRIAACLPALLAACAHLQHVPAAQREEVLRWEADGAHLRDTVVAVVPLAIGEGAEIEDIDARERAAIDAALVAGLQTWGGLARVHAVKGQEPMAEAREALADLLLEPSLRTCMVKYTGVNRWFIPAFFVNGTVWIPQWWMADEDYEGRVEVDFRWRSVHTGRELGRGTVAGRCSGAFDEPAKGWSVWGVLCNWPGAIGARQRRKIAEKLLPGACEDVAVAIARHCREELPEVLARPASQEALAKTMALVVGIANYQDRNIPRAEGAVRDADALAGYLRDAWDTVDDNLIVLKEFQATRDAIEKALGAMARRSRPPDRVFVYFAGCAAGDGAAPTTWLLPQDADAGNLSRTALSVSDITRLWSAMSAGRVYVVLDCAFGGSGGRTYAGGGETTPGADPFEGLVSRLPGAAVVLAASRPGEPALEIPREGHGLMTHYLLTGLRDGEADADHDGRVTTTELKIHLDRWVPGQAVFLGEGEQRPWVVAAHGGESMPWGGR